VAARYRRFIAQILTDCPRVSGHFLSHAIGVVGFSNPGGPPILIKESVNLVMTDQDFIFCALRQVGVIIAEHLESGSRHTDEVVTQLIAVLDTEELASAMNRVERWSGLRVVKEIKGAD
jgi:hypothetical protein